MEGSLAQVTLQQGRGYSHHLALQLVSHLLVLAEPVRRQNRCALLPLQLYLCQRNRVDGGLLYPFSGASTEARALLC